jgi:hypothetical protein
MRLKEMAERLPRRTIPKVRLENARLPPAISNLVSCPISNMAFAVGQLAVFQGASEAPISGSYGSSEQRRKTANWPRPGGLR